MTGIAGQLGQITAINSDIVFEPGKQGYYSYQQINTNVSVGEGQAMVNRSGSTLLLDQAITVDGDYIQEKDASLYIGVTDKNAYGSLQVTGDATVKDGAKFELKPRTYVFVGGQRFLVLQAQSLNLGEIEANAAAWQGDVRAEKTQSGGKDNLIITLHDKTIDKPVTLVSGILSEDIDGQGKPIVSASHTSTEINKKINLVGDYQLQKDATLKFGVSDNVTHGALHVSGKAELQDGAKLELISKDYQFTQNQRFLVLRADQLELGQNVSALAQGYDGEIKIEGTNEQRHEQGVNTLVLTLVEASEGDQTIIGEPIIDKPIIVDPGLNIATNNSNTPSVFEGLFSYVTGVDYALMELHNAGLALAATESSNTVNQAGAQLEPTANTAAAVGGANLISGAMLNAVQRRVASTEPMKDGSVPQGLWMQPFGGISKQGERDLVSGYRATYGGLHIGADRLLGDNLRVGTLYSYANTRSNLRDNNDGSTVKLNSHGLLGYASYSSEDWLLDMSLGALKHKYDSQRAIAFTGFAGNAQANFDGMQYLATVKAGYPITLRAGTIFTPMLGLSYSTLRQNDYRESQGNGAGLKVDALNTTSLKSSLGMRVEQQLSTDYGHLSPYVQLSWLHEYHNSREQINAQFSADVAGETRFGTKLPSSAANASSLSLGANLVSKNNVMLTADYSLDWAPGYNNQAMGAKLSYSF
ncbi:autotransporter outer membrane beta-barrel domain-containing protein [Serratia sp. JSRIV006]|uniref:autotransporter outer membrane beta-barrel domain-containing protein n=1 Tax=Serratia sp. JSRIV006 TaxID=2831896 RepID=UPI001CBB8BCE|nr:autotransporter outer membrane beta-barrel domain-containing protein [Serratia sp. JSRIV006]UAN62248.1 autotransporter outer membrane beta-barrel domain-containing protein [Serratia sp. JSRIV006]